MRVVIGKANQMNWMDYEKIVGPLIKKEEE